jgi:outer membrane lipoprotein-sorting protein
MKKVTLSFLILCLGFTSFTYAQESKAKTLLDEVSAKMTSYTNMKITFMSSLTNEDAGIKEGDEPPMKGDIILEGEKYNLNYMNINFIFDGKKLFVINHDEKEIASNDGDFDADDGFIYPSKLLTFYKDGYNYAMGTLKTIKGKQVQYVVLTPIDSDSDIVKVELGIDTKTKHIYQLAQTGSNSSKTTFTITSLKGNQTLSNNVFTLDKDAYLKKNYTID